jgi:DNA-binding XRE family transcriptional regulator
MREELYMGRLPQGLLVDGPKGCEVVIGPTGQHNQQLAPLEEVLGDGYTDKKKPANPRQAKALEIAEHLKELRETLGMTQEELAFHLGLSQLSICQIEGGYRRFRLSTAEKLLKLQPLYEERIGG